MMKKELRKMKVVQNREGPFEKENKTLYARNEDNNRR